MQVTEYSVQNKKECQFAEFALIGDAPLYFSRFISLENKNKEGHYEVIYYQ